MSQAWHTVGPVTGGSLQCSPEAEHDGGRAEGFAEKAGEGARVQVTMILKTTMPVTQDYGHGLLAGLPAPDPAPYPSVHSQHIN